MCSGNFLKYVDIKIRDEFMVLVCKFNFLKNVHRLIWIAGTRQKSTCAHTRRNYYVFAYVMYIRREKSMWIRMCRSTGEVVMIIDCFARICRIGFTGIAVNRCAMPVLHWTQCYDIARGRQYELQPRRRIRFIGTQVRSVTKRF